MRYVRVKATPGARREHIEQTGDDTYHIFVKEPPAANMANKRIMQILAEMYDVPSKSVRLHTGHMSRNKVFTL